MSDRGMMKWNAFNALIAHGSTVGEMMYNRKKMEQPVLTEDRLEEINFAIQFALEEGVPITITYFERGFLKEVSGLIAQVDLFSKMIHVNSQTIEFARIVNVETYR